VRIEADGGGQARRARAHDHYVKLNLDSYGGGFTARTLTFLMFWLISA
jgi:hypothetical protein